MPAARRILAPRMLRSRDSPPDASLATQFLLGGDRKSDHLEQVHDE
jgi:hypothetical protein